MLRFPPDPRQLIVLALFMAACGGGAQRESAPPQSPAPAGEGAAAPPGVQSGDADDAEPTTIEEAEAALQRARAELSSALGPPVSFAQAPPPAAQPAPAEASGAAPREERSQEAEKKAGPDCNLACRAFSSLQRAAQAVCRLDGDGGERCGRAQKAVADAEARVSSCGCPRP